MEKGGEKTLQQWTIRLSWNVDHYDIVIPALGPDVKVTGKTCEEAQDKGQTIVEQHWLTQYEEQEQTVA